MVDVDVGIAKELVKLYGWGCHQGRVPNPTSSGSPRSPPQQQQGCGMASWTLPAHRKGFGCLCWVFRLRPAWVPAPIEPLTLLSKQTCPRSHPGQIPSEALASLRGSLQSGPGFPGPVKNASAGACVWVCGPASPGTLAPHPCTVGPLSLGRPRARGKGFGRRAGTPLPHSLLPGL